MSLIPIESDAPFIEHVDAVIHATLSRAANEGVDPAAIEVTASVTERSNDEVELIRGRAADAGLALVLVDDRIPPRPGTVTRASLNPDQASGLAEARAIRILAGG